LTLADGTRVWLNAASSITYPTVFAGCDRKVSITGEVYFEVAANRQMPFIVTTSRQSIEVLGTHFNVNAYDDEQAQVTTLVEGSIRLTCQKEKVMVLPGQQALLANDANRQTFRVQKADMEQALAWRSNFFVFNNADLQNVLRQLSRWYDFDVQYKGKVPERSFQGKIPRDIPLSQVLSALAKMDINFEIKGKTLVVSP
jgi:ferric-dicitrate binding protein FerR (iron transport regulator)